MKEKQIVNQPISDELKGKLDVLMEAVAGIVGLASSCGLKEEAEALVQGCAGYGFACKPTNASDSGKEVCGYD